MLGRENIYDKWEESGMWSNFGGTRDDNEKNLECVLREFQEETNGFFGDVDKVREKILKNPNNIIIYNSNYKDITIFYRIPYNKKIIEYYK